MLEALAAVMASAALRDASDEMLDERRLARAGSPVTNTTCRSPRSAREPLLQKLDPPPRPAGCGASRLASLPAARRRESASSSLVAPTAAAVELRR